MAIAALVSEGISKINTYKDKDCDLSSVPNSYGFWHIYANDDNIERIVDSLQIDNGSKPMTFGGDRYGLNSKVFHIAEDMSERLSFFRNIGDNWTEEDDVSEIPLSVIKKAFRFYIKYLQAIFDNNDKLLSLPSINPARDGSIQFEWRNRHHILLIHISNSKGCPIHFYGESLKDNNSTKGILEGTNIELLYSLLPWINLFSK